MINPNIDLDNLSIEKKIDLVKESDGLLIELLEGETFIDLVFQKILRLLIFLQEDAHP